MRSSRSASFVDSSNIGLLWKNAYIQKILGKQIKVTGGLLLGQDGVSKCNFIF